MTKLHSGRTQIFSLSNNLPKYWTEAEVPAVRKARKVPAFHKVASTLPVWMMWEVRLKRPSGSNCLGLKSNHSSGPRPTHHQKLLEVGFNVLVVQSEEGSRHLYDGFGQTVDVVVVA